MLSFNDPHLKFPYFMMLPLSTTLFEHIWVSGEVSLHCLVKPNHKKLVRLILHFFTFV